MNKYNENGPKTSKIAKNILKHTKFPKMPLKLKIDRNTPEIFKMTKIPLKLIK